MNFTILSCLPSLSGLPSGWILSIFSFMISFLIPLSVESVVMIFSQSESWSSSFFRLYHAVYNKAWLSRVLLLSSSLFSRYSLLSNWVSRNCTLFSSAIILFFSSWYWSCTWFMLGVNSDSVVRMFLVLVSDLVILLYFDDGYHFLRSWSSTFLRRLLFIGLCYFCFFQNLLVRLDNDFWLLCSFGPENVLYAYISTIK